MAHADAEMMPLFRHDAMLMIFAMTPLRHYLMLSLFRPPRFHCAFCWRLRHITADCLRLRR